MCQCSCGLSGWTKPVPLRLFFLFHLARSPAFERTRQVVAGLTATMSQSSIMKVNRRYPSRGLSMQNPMIDSRSHGSSQKSRGIGALCSLAFPYRPIQV